MPQSNVEKLTEAQSILGSKEATKIPMFDMEQLFQEREKDNFHKWFGKSKVADASGDPIPVYHGTSASNFDAFDIKRDSGRNLYGPGFYHTEDRELAQT